MQLMMLRKEMSQSCRTKSEREGEREKGMLRRRRAQESSRGNKEKLMQSAGAGCDGDGMGGDE